MNIVNNKSLDIYLKYSGEEKSFLEKATKEEMDTMSWALWHTIATLVEISILLREYEHDGFSGFADKVFSGYCESKDVAQRIMDIDFKKLYFD